MVKQNRQIPNPFEVGLPVQMDVLFKKGKALQIQVTLIGWLPSEFLIVKAEYDSRFLVVKKGTKVLCRYIYDGTVYEFTSYIQQTIKEPSFIWFIEYPESYRISYLRSNDRIPLRVRVIDNNGRIYYSKDISKDGIALILKSNTQLKEPEGSQLALSFKILDDAVVHKLKSEIVRYYSEGGKFLMGMKFDTDNITEMEKISDFLQIMKGYIH